MHLPPSTQQPLPAGSPRARSASGSLPEPACLAACLPTYRPYRRVQVHALVIKYPLVLNFQEASVARAYQVRLAPPPPHPTSVAVGCRETARFHTSYQHLGT